MIRSIAILFSFASSLSFAQCRYIDIESIALGGEDATIIPSVILEDTLCLDYFLAHVDHSKVHFVGLSEFRTESFKILAEEFEAIGDSTMTHSGFEWGHLQITLYDASDNIVYRRFICCEAETASTLQGIIDKELVGKNDEVLGVIKQYIHMINKE